ncbi:MAG: hypothetical protein QF664_00600 [Dehalococcoidia bacterium]|jgi:hypothetical protein|nr:hypothetical protein [Dehalococcoidia bacterium]
MSESQRLARELLDSITETVDQLQRLTDAHLDHDCSHGCAMDGGVRRLLVHNAEHDRMHAGAVSGARYHGGVMQESELAKLLRDWLRERVELVGQLLTAPDEVLELSGDGDEWSLREHVEHVLYWERDSIDTAMREASGEEAAPAAGQPGS